LGDVHIYENHIEGAKEQLSRDVDMYPLSKIETNDFTSIFEWEYRSTNVLGYESQPRIKFDIAI
jgi:thymidylate synthase